MNSLEYQLACIRQLHDEMEASNQFRKYGLSWVKWEIEKLETLVAKANAK